MTATDRIYYPRSFQSPNYNPIRVSGGNEISGVATASGLRWRAGLPKLETEALEQGE